MEVAQHLGILGAIQAWWATVRGVAAHDLTVNDHKPNGHIIDWFCYLLAFVLGMLMATLINWMMKPKKKEARSIGVQSQTTYTLHAERPRFRPLQPAMHGAYE